VIMRVEVSSFLTQHLACLALALLPCCGASPPPPESDEAAPGQGTSAEVEAVEPTLCSVAFAPEPGAEQVVTRATERWSAATGCSVHSDPSGIPVVPSAQLFTSADGSVTAESNPDGSLKSLCGRTMWNADRTEVLVIRIAVRDSWCEPEYVAVHELGHALARVQGHALAGVMAPGQTPEASSIITPESLEFVCTGLPCVVMRPE
jgi:hypothetical protein